MSPLVESTEEPEGPLEPAGNWRVKITIPKEYIGYVLAELSSRNGYVEGMDGQQEQETVEAVLPAREFKAMAKIVAGLSGAGIGKIERDNSS